jgi:general secretion pathway protein K
MALVSVIWGIALLSVIAVSFLWSGSTSHKLARNGLDMAQIETIAEAAVNRAVLALLEPLPERRWRTDGVPQSFEFEGSVVRIRIQDELGRIDLNNADAPLIAGLLRAAGLDMDSASRLTDKILDWRDASTLKRLNGAKDAEYRAAGLPYRPRNGPFQSVDELKLVMDMTPAIFQRIEPAITVYSRRQFIDPQVAPREALLALPTMDAEKVAAQLAARAGQNLGIPGSLNGRAFTIRADIERPGGPQAREAVVRLTGNPAQPYWLLDWRKPAPAEKS